MTTAFDLDARHLIKLAYIAIVLGMLVPRYLLAPLIIRRHYGWATGVFAAAMAVNACIYVFVIATESTTPTSESFSGMFLSLFVALVLCHIAKAKAKATRGDAVHEAEKTGESH